MENWPGGLRAFSSQQLTGTEQRHSSKPPWFPEDRLGSAPMISINCTFRGVGVISSGEATTDNWLLQSVSLGKRPHPQQAAHISKGLPAAQADPPCTAAPAPHAGGTESFPCYMAQCKAAAWWKKNIIEVLCRWLHRALGIRAQSILLPNPSFQGVRGKMIAWR